MGCHADGRDAARGGCRPAGGSDLLASGRVEIRHLRAFTTVAEELSFTRAARRLRLSQSSLTRTVDALERSLGARLLTRTTRRVALTDEGMRLKADLDRLFKELDSALQVGAAGPLRLGFAWLLPDVWAQEAIGRFEEATGSVVELVRTDDVLAGIDQDRADIAVVRGLAPAGFESVLLFRERRVAAVGRGSPLADLPSIPWMELARQPLVVNRGSGTTRPEHWPAASRPTPVTECGNFDEWLESVAAGRGVGVVPGIAVHRVSHPAVVYVPVRGAPLVPVRLAYPRQGAHPLVNSFVRAALGAHLPSYAFPP
jgi:DNA-binding transcriptional LysR family regulator